MWDVIRSALVARRGQALILLAIAWLAGTALAAAPWYAVSARQQVGVATAERAAAPERLVSAAWRPDSSHQVPDAPVEAIRDLFTPAGFTSVVGAKAEAELLLRPTEDGSISITVAFREGVCGRLVLIGECASAPDEVMLPAALADEVDVGSGDEIAIEHFERDASGVRPVAVPVTVSGVYATVDPRDPYWADAALLGAGENREPDRATVFVAAPAMRDYQDVTYTHDLTIDPSLLATADVDRLNSDLGAGLDELRRHDFEVGAAGLYALLERVDRERRNVVTGVGVGVLLLVGLTWSALVVVVREAALQTQADVGWWRLHGAPAGRGWFVVLVQGVAPLTAGAVAGVPCGLILGRVLGGRIDGDDGRMATLLAMVLVGATLAGGLFAMVAAQLRTLRMPVRDLLHQGAVRRRRWLRSMAEIVLIALAAGAVGQAVTVGSDAHGLALLAPALTSAALVVMASWIIPRVLRWLTSRALRGGRPALALVAANLARLPGTRRVFTLAGVVVAVLTTALVGYDVNERTEADRAALEAGADRVVSVLADDPAHLLSAVRMADPDGTSAMAVVEQPTTGDMPPVLAVDSTRLAVVTGWRAEYGGAVDELAAVLRPQEPDVTVLRTERIRVDAAGRSPSRTALYASVTLREQESGEPVQAVFGPLRQTPETYTAGTPECASGCRLVGVEVLADDSEPPPSGAWVEIHRVSGGDQQQSSASASPTDPARWRPALGPRDLGPLISAAGPALRLRIPDASSAALSRNDQVFVADAPAPLPVVTAGWHPPSVAEPRLAPLSGPPVPVRPAATASLIPRLGETGAVVDLEYAERQQPATVGQGGFQVWVSSSAHPAILEELEAAGLTVLEEETLSDHLGRLAASGSAVGARFAVVVGIIGVVLLVGVLLAYAIRERPFRRAEWAALRIQGLSVKQRRVVEHGGLFAAVGAAVVVGSVAGLAAAAVGQLLRPGFVDGWSVLSTSPVRPIPALIVAATAAAVLGAAAWSVDVALVRRTRAGSVGGPASPGAATPWEAA
ncbi:hypothetical protein [Phytoactinopolyspora halotolerans]|uniref:FtsX-like permease family protein n=1 Tax=Phytoactinopolyspora halotolerans TaxID=1981512 RepID=A0A6L9S5R7_9ACTN|nr:hypothetical protein [Phytoactinopolyspora halotolerans]NED99837.1 hypothetical protein [Phytoactinopolyspora halotolerans]